MRVNGKNIYIKDLPKNKALITDIIRQVSIANINRDLQNEPANVIYPESFTSYGKKMLGRDRRLSVEVLDEIALKRQGFNLILAMGQGSVHKPRFMIVRYTPNKAYKTVCLVGKGVTFDTGGIDLKPSDNDFYQMKSDKTGGATVLALIRYACEAGIKLNIVGLIPLIENAVSGSAVRPGDIVRSYAGKTVEILDSDAEGRVIMADAFGYAGTLKGVDWIIDLVTLTGAAERFHCDTAAAFFTLNEKIAGTIKEIGESVGERVYQLPPWPEYVQYTKSDVADVKNIDMGECSKSGSFMATMFLLNFVPLDLRGKWVHFDITHSYSGHLSNGNCTILVMNLLKRMSEYI